MTDRRPDHADDLEVRLRSWMRTEHSEHVPSRLFGAVVDATQARAQRPAAFVARHNRERLEPQSPGSLLRLLPIAATVTLLVALALVVGAFVGSQTRDDARSDRPSGAFVTTGDLPTSLGWLIRPGVALLHDGRVLVAGGGQEQPRAIVYDPASGTFGEPIPMPSMHQNATATTLLDGRVLIVGGNDAMNGTILKDASLYDPVAHAVMATGSLGVPREGHTATLLDDGRVLLAGGYSDVLGPQTQALASAELFDPRTGTFSPTSPLSTARADHSATKLPDGRVVVIGGFDSVDTMTGETSPVPTAEVFDPEAGTFAAIGSLVTPRAGHGTVLLDDGRLLVVGGGGVTSSSIPQSRVILGSAEILDPATGTFTATTGSLTTERSHPSLALLPSGQVLVVGGSNGFGAPLTAESFDPGSGTFRVMGTTASAHTIGTAVSLLDGRVFLPGEGAAPDGGTELWVPGARDETPLASAAATGLPRRASAADQPVETTLRTGHTATRLRDGRVLIAGGYGGDTNDVLATAEIYDPISGRSTPTGSMTIPRGEHLASLLPDGRVLIVGGEGPTFTAEVFDPVTGSFGPASPEIAEALEGRRPVRGPGEGRMILLEEGTSGAVIRTLDLETARLTKATPVCDHFDKAVALDDGRLFLACALHGASLIYDPDAGTASDAPGTDVEDGLWEPFGLADGRVLTAMRQGGDVDAVRYAYTRVYDPERGELTLFAPESSPAPMAGVVAQLDDGRLLLAGGVWGNASDAIRILDPLTWQYREVGHLLTPRADPTVTVLDDGRILVVGGADRSPDRTVPIPPGAELIDPKLLDLDR